MAWGAEGGGHGQPTIGTLPLLEAVLDAVEVPVLAAGGIATRARRRRRPRGGSVRGMAGNRLRGLPQLLNTDAARHALLRASGADTVVTRVFDVALGYPWPPEYPERVLRNEFTDRWTGDDVQPAADRDASTAPTTAICAGDAAMMPVNVGQGVGSLTEARSVADVIERLCVDASSRSSAQMGTVSLVPGDEGRTGRLGLALRAPERNDDSVGH